MSRIQALLTAGALTGLVLVALFWYGTNKSEAASVKTVTTVPAAITVPKESATLDVQSLLEQNQELRATVNTLLSREKEYRRQIEAANQQLLNPQRQATSTRFGSGGLFQGEYDEEDDEYENGEHEKYEHEEYEHEEHGEDDEDD